MLLNVRGIDDRLIAAEQRKALLRLIFKNDYLIALLRQPQCTGSTGVAVTEN